MFWLFFFIKLNFVFFYSSGSLITRNLNDVVKKEYFVLNSEYLKTLLVCVPRLLINDWYAKYETLCSMIVPRTTELIIEDQDYALFTVTLFQKTEDTFRHKCRENKYVKIIGKNNINFCFYI
jgi:V-type H+-transporting ATPase subunit C